MYKIESSKTFDLELDEAYNHIKDEFHSIISAENLFKVLKQKLLYLKEMPLAWPLVRDEYFASLGFRSIQVNNYTLFYIVIVKKKVVRLARFIHGSRDYLNLLSEEFE